MATIEVWVDGVRITNAFRVSGQVALSTQTAASFTLLADDAQVSDVAVDLPAEVRIVGASASKSTWWIVTAVEDTIVSDGEEAAEVIEVTPTAGSMCFVPSPLDPANPSLATVAWTYPGTVPGNPPLASGTPTPWFAFNAGIPFPIEAAIQTIISEGPYLRVSNMVILKVQ